VVAREGRGDGGSEANDADAAASERKCKPPLSAADERDSSSSLMKIAQQQNADDGAGPSRRSG
jgi:hypothetical protein